MFYFKYNKKIPVLSWQPNPTTASENKKVKLSVNNSAEMKSCSSDSLPHAYVFAGR